MFSFSLFIFLTCKPLLTLVFEFKIWDRHIIVFYFNFLASLYNNIYIYTLLHLLPICFYISISVLIIVAYVLLSFTRNPL